MTTRKLVTKGGKTLQVDISVERGRVRSVSFSGDFYLYPEESIRELEKSLEGIRADETEYSISTRLMIAARKAGTEMAGVTPYEMATAVAKTIEKERRGLL